MRSVLITGATGGLGQASALRFAAAGWHVIVGGRRRAAVHDVVNQIEAKGGTASEFVADLADLDAVKTAISTFSWPRLGAIVANAGIMLAEKQRSRDGYELTFAVNVLAHQLIVGSLLGYLDDDARIVFVSSGTQIPEHKLARRAGIPVPNWMGVDALANPDRAPEPMEDPRQAYTTSKLGNVIQARAFQSHLRETKGGVDVFAIDPGVMPGTGLMGSAPAFLRLVAPVLARVASLFIDGIRTPKTSAAHIQRLVEDPALTGEGMTYFDGANAYPASADGLNDAYRDALWTDANRLVGLDVDIATPRRAAAG